ncbi:MAG: BatD family protein [Epsilonproteobacteria bacterium]|nr:BatD family protein [Campylobacterota bacterium]
MSKILSLGRVFFILLFTNILLADITATVDKKIFYQGDTVTLQIKAIGDDITFPNIKDIGGFPIVGTSTSEQIYVVNGKTTRGKIVNYMFVPNQSMEIPTFIIKVNGQSYRTNKISIKKTIPHVSTSKDDIVLFLETNKDTTYVGESIIATVIFKYKAGLNLVDAKLEPFKPNNFWVKELKSEEPREERGYMVYKNSFLVFPQKSGNLKLDNQLITVAIRDVNSYDAKQLKIFSNDKIIKVLPLSGGLTVQGKYNINATVDKVQTTSNDPTNLTISIEGIGNIDDIEEFKLDLPEQVVYSSKPTITSGLVDGNYGGTFIQKISIISDKSFTIPSIHFRYFDRVSKKEVDINTTSFFIQVTGKKKVKSQVLEQANTAMSITNDGENKNIKYLYAFVGISFGSIVTFLVMRKKAMKLAIKEKPFEVAIKKAKTDKELYDLLLPYSQKIELKTFVKQLEENIYFNKTNKIDKKELIEIFQSKEI